MSLYFNSSQLYFDSVYYQCLNEHSESKYLLDLIKVIDWFVVPAFNHKYGRFGYSNQSILKALFVQKVKGFNTRELIYFLRTNLHFGQAIGFDPINNYVSSEASSSIRL